jgi:hypothetical protein
VQLAVVVAGRGAGFVVAQTGFHVRHDLAQRLERQRMELVETDVEQGFDHAFPPGRELVQFAATSSSSL